MGTVLIFMLGLLFMPEAVLLCRRVSFFFMLALFYAGGPLSMRPMVFFFVGDAFSPPHLPPLPGGKGAPSSSSLLFAGDWLRTTDGSFLSMRTVPLCWGFSSSAEGVFKCW